MDSGIKLTTTELIFTEFSTKEIGSAMFCKSFKIKLENIKLIGLSPRLALDDEVFFILIIDLLGNIYPIPDSVLGTEGCNQFEKYFNLNPIHNEWGHFEYEDHYGKTDKIVYPKEQYWNDLFKKDWKLFLRGFYSWISPRSFYGNLNTTN
ncbi:hypothetical protein [uncultured Tenacibaculum sp.]|uniref:hypothetical protein n=1 Tax=uncultured Tenacibaculum sp. TaxID=174713 RepID=UPI00262F486D|nr:hypothetical protein [uncultured Tenacibaculum sp.]